MGVPLLTQSQARWTFSNDRMETRSSRFTDRAHGISYVLRKFIRLGQEFRSGSGRESGRCGFVDISEHLPIYTIQTKRENHTPEPVHTDKSSLIHIGDNVPTFYVCLQPNNPPGGFRLIFGITGCCGDIGVWTGAPYACSGAVGLGAYPAGIGAVCMGS